ncbi:MULTISPECIES: phosphoenolpyruvate carboxylase [Alteromonas]|jgi:phosphoenolpyruvate carboxylase|uniref:Phosphoenolpyruvate carboxylase n=2 Tax=Alteromonas mediterranea TaxID=314275 RepID=A0AAC9F7K9_9ALTE|nr:MULTISPECIES: phosphoenolpyruvate carboxylase [Alteromonas]MBR9897849.1 phosphoenolpyruvate carboxylase [Gammaproteobacteria bacterium]MEA3379826.1 phosphoenolpyruvate carboxylase [Pseudomonadota bacterium]AFV86957.1 phosphoenolpyruvate carboxylase [Alteromonas mediterranea DE1]AGP98971.1 phosphoenolpyruvate carboxylase [Alteromonas mediterranea UM7]AGQ03151.1 phosphoenolpyruvate carboxylase [Alteromonas mediterranea UM4b]|tara:strand:- start:2242 stop:4863 length:2622 start_codon:yes stop_codon:yes gene_type:complete
MQTHYDAELKDTVRYLGKTLGETIKNQLGQEWLDRIEKIRKGGRASYQGDATCSEELKETFKTMSDSDLLTVGRAFAQFLNLGNIAEQEYNAAMNVDASIDALFKHLDKAELTADKVQDAVAKLNIDLVLTAHPTEVTRRTLIHKHKELADCLQAVHQASLSDVERKKIETRIADLIAQAWHTEEIRSVRPTPVDEARWGFSVIENSLWEAVPDFMRELDGRLNEDYDVSLPLDASPVQFSSWMGGDRDGNPFVTSKVTEQVLLLARKRAAKLFALDLDRLQVELSMYDCNDELRDKVGDANEPYRALLRPLVNKFIATRDGIADYLAGKNPDTSNWIESDDELIEPLMLCYQSLIDCGMQVVANGLLLDTIRRARVFGIHLLRLDVRQDSERHADVFSELTRYLGLGDYAQWSEADKQAFLLRELGSKRPLFPAQWDASDDVKEVLDTCKVIAKHSKHGFGIYIISMASEPSDVMAVQLLLQESGVDWPMPVAPLFETLDDLNNSPDVMRKLLSIDWYRGYVKGRQFVMIGYSDSAKDAGALAAGWAQYQSQEALVAIAEEFDVSLTLFHGRGGTIGRGGLPAHAAIYSQPPGSLEGGFRVTEQGETIRYKFGMPKLAKRSLGIYASAIIEAMLFPPPAPKEEWRELITTMAAQGRDNYRATVRHDEEFVPYFRVATPEQELGKLPLGSRPAKRKPQGGIESLRAIPWIFAWAQTRLVLPSWLGVMRAIDSVKTPENEKVVNEMFSEWPFYRSRLSMLDMVFHKADPRISEAYDERLVPKELKHFGEALRSELKESISSLLAITGDDDIMKNDPQGKESMEIRAGYLQPLHYLQIELLDRIRKAGDDAQNTSLERAMMVTIAGIAIGMRNTG